jgi:uncharacterized membrane protein
MNPTWWRAPPQHAVSPWPLFARSWTRFTRELPAAVALPLLLGVGVAFKIFCVMAWRAGKTALLQSVLTRAVIFSAMTTATAFGSLWLSNHPGTSSKLMALALVCTMAAAVLFQPALMGPPWEERGT